MSLLASVYEPQSCPNYLATRTVEMRLALACTENMAGFCRIVVGRNLITKDILILMVDCDMCICNLQFIDCSVAVLFALMQLAKADDLDDAIEMVVAEFEEKHGKTLLHSIAFY